MALDCASVPLNTVSTTTGNQDQYKSPGHRTVTRMAAKLADNSCRTQIRIHLFLSLGDPLAKATDENE
jgi:hypothetical protein